MSARGCLHRIMLGHWPEWESLHGDFGRGWMFTGRYIRCKRCGITRSLESVRRQ